MIKLYGFAVDTKKGDRVYYNTECFAVVLNYNSHLYLIMEWSKDFSFAFYNHNDILPWLMSTTIDNFLLSSKRFINVVHFFLTAPNICPPNWILWNTMCYFIANNSQSSKVSWRVARKACQSIRGGDLVSILSAAENNFIKSKIAGYVFCNKVHPFLYSI